MPPRNPNRRGKQEGIDLNSIIQSAAQEAFTIIKEDHPRFKLNSSLLGRHLKTNELTRAAREIYRHGEDEHYSGNDLANYVHEQLKNYVASGQAFDEEGKEIILRQGLRHRAEQKGFLGRLFARRQLKSEEKIDQGVNAFTDLYEMFQQGNYKEQMPELQKPLEKLNRVGFLDPALDVLKEYNLIKSGQYRSLKKEAERTVKSESSKFVKGIESYLSTGSGTWDRIRKGVEYGIASTTNIVERGQGAINDLGYYLSPPKNSMTIILGIAGLAILLASGLSMTGAVIGTGSQESISIMSTLGFAMMCVSAILFFARRK